MARVGKTLQGNVNRSDNSWSYQDKDTVIRSVQDIMKGGSGQTEEYDPVLMTKINQALNMVNDFAHGTPQEEIDDKYNSVPEDIKSGIKTTSQGVNVKGNMTNYQLNSQAKDYGFKLSDNELDLLQRRPGIQSQYLNVKKSSMIWDSDQMESLMATILADIQTGNIKHKGQLKVRLQQVLNMDNADDVDYLAEDLWADFTANMTNGEKMNRIRSKYKELFGFKDRTWEQKGKETAVGLLNGIKKATVNGLHWLTEATADVGQSIGYGIGKAYGAEENPEGRVPSDVNLWKIDENALSPDTKEAVDYLKAYGLGTGAYNVLQVYYDAMQETTDAKIDKAFDKFADFGYEGGYGPNLGNNAQSAEMIEENSNYYGAGEFVGASIPEIYVTSKIGSALTMSNATLSKLPWRWKYPVQMLNRVTTSAVEGVAFSAMEEGEVDAGTVGLYTAIGTIVGPMTNAIGNSLAKWSVKKRMGKELFNRTTKDVVRSLERDGVNVSLSQGEKIVVDTVLEGAMGGKLDYKAFGTVFAGNPLEKGASYSEQFISDLQKSIIDDLSKSTGKYKNPYVRDMLDKLFGQPADKLDEAYAVFENARMGAGATKAEVESEWEMMKKLWESGTKDFTLVEQETTRKAMGTIENTYGKKGNPLAGLDNARWRNRQISARNVIEDYATKEGIADLGDRYLQEHVMINAKSGFEKSMTTSMSDILNRYAGRTLVGGLGAYVASQTMGDGPLSNPYVATATTLLVMSLGGSPRVSMLTSKIASKMSTVEAYSLINSADEGTLWKLSKWDSQEFVKVSRGVLYSDFVDWLVGEMDENTAEVENDYTNYSDYDMDAVIRDEFGLY